MNIPNQILEELNQKSFNPSGMNSVVGLDGFVDKIVTPVDKRHGLEENFAPIKTLEALGSRISAAAGKSANIELFPRFDKLGKSSIFALFPAAAEILDPSASSVSIGAKLSSSP